MMRRTMTTPSSQSPTRRRTIPGGVIATVAIADVAAYVRYGTALDREALKRGNSVYFPDRVVPMLPERISNDLCSLREGQDRPALAVRMTFSADGHKIRHSFHRVMMKSAAKLAYPQAQAAIDGLPDDKTGPILDTVLKPLWDAYAILKRGRDGRQPLELDLPERKILLKPDGTVDRVIVPERLDAHKLIEEFMIQANVAAAETLEAKKQALVYRVHDAPSLAKQESLREFLQTLGLSLARGAQMRPSQFNGILERVRGADNEGLVNEVVLRSQSQAEYSPGNIGHFGLNLRRYAHFTSPIRRYADLIVHRALVASLGLGPGADAGRSGSARRRRGTDLRHRTARHGSRARYGRPADRGLSRRAYRRPLRRPHLRRHQIRTICPIAAVWRRWLHPGVNSGRRLLYIRRNGSLPVRRTLGQRLPARRPRRGPARRGGTDGWRDALRDVDRPEAPARLQQVVSQG